jgi:NAD(P)-dependent dehydrogenase (short-subunit alcohol dehydrogenase family)
MPRMTKPGYLVDAIGQSPPLDTSAPYDSTWVAGKTILITGGASGFGEGFLRKWAENGANVIIGDINKTKGGVVVKEVRKSTGNLNHHFLYCDVTDWQSQVDFFRDAVKLSPTGGKARVALDLEYTTDTS